MKKFMKAFTRIFLSGCLTILVAAASCSSPASKPSDNNNPLAQNDSAYWLPVLVSPQMDSIETAIGGKWLPVEELPEYMRPDSTITALRYQGLDAAAVVKANVLNQLADSCEGIYLNQERNKITPEEFKKIPFESISSVFYFNKVMTLQTIDSKTTPKTNPALAVALYFQFAEMIDDLD